MYDECQDLSRRNKRKAIILHIDISIAEDNLMIVRVDCLSGKFRFNVKRVELATLRELRDRQRAWKKNADFRQKHLARRGKINRIIIARPA